MVIAAMKLRRLLLGRKAIINLDGALKTRCHFADKGPYNQNFGFSCHHVWMWELDYKKGWAPKNWCFWSVVLEKTLESPWTARSNQSILKEISPEYSLECWCWSSNVKSWLIGRDPDAGKDWGQQENGATEDEMVGWHHQLNEYKFK